MQEKKKYYRSTPKNKVNVEKQQKSNVRKYIYKCLCNIYIEKAYSNIDIDHMIRENNLSLLDRKLLTNVVYGTLQHEKILNWELEQLTDKMPKLSVKILIWMSLYQLRYLTKVPSFAITNEAVEIAKEFEGPITAKYVNAILREAMRSNYQLLKEDFKKEEDYLSIYYNVPTWVINMWIRHYGKEKTLATLECSNKEAPLSCRVNLSLSSVDEILENKDFYKGTLAKNSVIYTGNEPIMDSKFFKENKISIQDESSQYVVELLDPQENEAILDMCAAPGSKTTYIAQMMNNTGKILALDIHEHRVQLMKKYLANLNITNTSCICFDSTKLSTKTKLLNSFDRILLDAPCSGLGVMRRKPDILLDLAPSKLDELVIIQEKLLDEAYKMLKDNGILVYSTCTINKKENDAQITAFLAKHKDMKRIEEKQIFPQDHNSDGFYICKLIKG